MEISTNLGFYLPSSNSDDIADINQISDNFRNLDEYIPGMMREVKADIRTKQDVLVSGENIKSVNGESLLGEGNLELSVEVDQVFNAKSKNAQSGVAIANTFANALKGNKSGEIVSMTDVSPIEHNVMVKISGVEDLTAVSVKKLGKNLFNGELKPSSLSWDTTGIYKRIEIYLTKGTYTFSFSTAVYVQATDINQLNGNFTTRTVTVDEDKEYYLQFRIDGEPNVPWDNSITVQIAVGNDTEYEPYQETTYTPNADGTVESVTSLYPNMTLITDTSGVIIDAEYNRDINKAFAELQNAIINLGGTL